MISTKIIGRASFLKMPVSSQCLYFHLVARADDDGIVEAFSVMNMCNLNEDDLRILHAKGFVYVLNEDLVTFIRNWREMNILRADRKTDSIYLDLLMEKLPEEIILEHRPRSDTKKGRREASERKKNLDGPRTAQENLIQINSNQQNRIEDKKMESPSIYLPSVIAGDPERGMERATSTLTEISQEPPIAAPETAAIRAVIAENIDLPYLQDIGRRHGISEEAMVNEIYDSICDMVIYPRQIVRIKDRDIPWETVRSRFMKLTFTHVSNVLNRIIDKKLGIRNMHSYLISTLYTESLCGTLAEQSDLHDDYLKEARGAPYYFGG